MRNRYITCIGSNGVRGFFNEIDFNPFLLSDADGLYLMDGDVNTQNSTMNDGSTYHSTMLKERNIVLTLRDKENFNDNRVYLNTLFSPKSKGTLYINDGNIERMINYYVEKVESNGTNYSRIYTISLICPDPYFYDLYPSNVTMAAYIPSFTFPHNFLASKEELGYRQRERIRDIVNSSGAEEIGMNIEITCNGSVTNPVITNITHSESLKLGTSSKPLNLVAGDVITVDTREGYKNVYLTRDGTTTGINQYLSEDSTFLSLYRGDNQIGYSADAGTDSLIVKLSYQMRYTSA